MATLHGQADRRPVLHLEEVGACGQRSLALAPDARRIVCDAVAGSTVLAGDTYGLIRFGSRVDTYLPAGAELVIRQGQRTIGGETVLATLSTAAGGHPPDDVVPNETP